MSYAQNSILWKISGNGLKSPSYLYGTVHMLCKDDFVWNEGMKKAFANTSQICFELPFDDNTTKEMSKYDKLPEGKTLKDYYTKLQYDTLSQYFKDSLHMSIESFARMKPFSIMSLVMYANMPCKDVVFCEMEIKKMNGSSKKRVIGLETIKEEMEYLDQSNQDSIACYTISIISNPQKHKAEFAKMVISYKKQNIDELHHLLEQNDGSNAGIDMKKLVDERNRNWVPRIRKIINQKSTFIAVGAGHLGGKNGVIALLKKQGFKVVPIY